MRITLFLSFLALCCVFLLVECAPLEERKVKLAKPKLAAPKPKPVALAKPKVAAPKAVAKPKPVKPKPVAKPKVVAPPPAKPKVVAKPKAAAPAKPKVVAKPKAAAPAKAVAPPKKVTPPPKTTTTAAPKNAPPKAAQTKACPVKKTSGKKAQKVAGRNTDDECDTTEIDNEICNDVTDCTQCITTPTSSGTKCGFTFDTGKCEAPKTGLKLATSVAQCKQIATQQTASAASSDDGILQQAATTAFNKILPHILGTGAAEKKNKSSGRHLLSVWTKDNPGSAEIDRNDKTGIVVFDIAGNRDARKSVWNDVKSGATHVYSEANVKTLCERAMFFSIKANPTTKAILADINGAATIAAAPVAAGKKGKGKKVATAPAKTAKDLAPLGVNGANAFVVHNTFIGQNVCIVASTASCFPTSVGTVSGNEGDTCNGDVSDELDP